MRTFRFIHCADLHLDSPFKCLAKLDKDLAATCREATFGALKRIVDLALEQQVDFLTIGGDSYDSADRSLRAGVFFRDQMARLRQRGVPVFIVAGNHDPLDTLITPLQLPENVHLFSGQPESAPVLLAGVEAARVYGISFSSSREVENMALRIRRNHDSSFAIGLLHCNVAGQVGHENYAPCTLADLVSAGMDAWCLGHVHSRGVLLPSHPLVLYPGNPQGRHSNESGQRGCVLVKVDEGARIATQFLPVHQVRWELVEVDIAASGDVDALLEGIENHLHRACEGWKEELVVVRILWNGRGPLHGWLSEQKKEDLRSMLQERLSGSGPDVCIESIENATRAPLDRESLLRQESFAGDFLRLVQEAREGGPALDVVMDSLTELFAHRLCRRFLSEGKLAAAWKRDHAAVQELLDEAESLALDHLMRERA